MLVDYFGGVYSGVGRPRLFTRAALDVLSRYPWPGNVRELRHEIVRLMLMSDEEQIDEMCLAARIRETPGDRDTYALPFKEARRINIEQFVTEYLHRQLLRTRGNVTLAARESGVGRQYFQMQMSACGLQSKAYKQASSIAR
jgi:DNA-binding NtrC family response regulator